MRAFLSAAFAMFLCSCATMSPEACQVADWRGLGAVDGAEGAAMSKYEARAADCAKAGVTADFAAYSAGRSEGLRSFCQPGAGFRAGLAGYVYGGVCPGELEGDFLLGYRDGARAYGVQQALAGAESAVSSARGERDGIDEKQRFFESELRRANATAQEKEFARKRLDELRADARRARDRIRDAEFDRDRAAFSLDQTRAEIGMRWGGW